MVLTIGHSNHPLEFFLELLARHHVAAVADVRSAPYSRFNPQYNREHLAATLKACDIGYVFLGSELGERSDDPSCYEHGHIRYDRLADTPGFRRGLERVERGMEDYRIALMCAERDPLHCHRTLLVGHHIDERGTDVVHILPDGSLEAHATAMDRRLVELDFEDDSHMTLPFKPRVDLVSEAIARQAVRVGHAIDQAPGNRYKTGHR